MKKEYYLRMISIFPLCIAIDLIYLIFHKTLTIFFGMVAVHFFMFVIINLIGTHFIFKPIDIMIKTGVETIKAKKRINDLNIKSATWIFFIGFLFVLLAISSMIFDAAIYEDSDQLQMDKIPVKFILSIIPGTTYIFSVLTSFLMYFYINEYSLTLKTEIYNRLKILYPVGKMKIGLVLLSVIIVLCFLPMLLTVLELYSAMDTEFSDFINLQDLATVLTDRLITFLCMILSAIIIPRSFTKPIYSLLDKINSVAQGDYTIQAPIVSNDEIGLLTKEFNNMVIGLQEREHIRDTFGKYVTDDVAKIILDKKIDLEGEVRPCTIMVTDIQNYTTISENLTPKEIVTMLNHYFSAIVKIVEKYNGIVNKFIGDSVFVMFNVPLDDPKHAENAIKASLEIIKITEKYTFQNRKLNTRIGINTGVIVAGNIGSKNRMEYTVIGDDVNIAARLEQLNKEHGTNILVGENTYFETKDLFTFAQLGSIKLKGKEKNVNVFKVINK